MVSTTIFTTVIPPAPSRKFFAFPHTLSVEKRKGSGRLFLESTHTIFYREWQSQLKTIFELVRTLFSLEDWDFFVSVDCEAVEGSSASIPLFLLFASSISGEKIPENVFSTGSMSSQNGFLSFGHFESLKAKIMALEHFVSYTPVEDPQFLIPFPFYYGSDRIRSIQVASVFSALKIVLPETFRSCESKIGTVSHVTSVVPKTVLDVIPLTGDVFVIYSPEVDAPCKIINEGGTLVVVEELPPSDTAHVHFICDGRVILAHQFANRQVALEKVSEYKELLRNSIRQSVVF